MAKARLYKMVNPGVIKRGGITVKVGDKTITQPTINFSKNISAINSLGATVNSIAILTQDLKDTFQEYSKTSISNYEEQLNKRREQLEVEQKERDDAEQALLTEQGRKKDDKSEGKQESKLKTALKGSLGVMKKVGKAAFGSLEKIASTFGSLISKFIAYQVMKWMSDPQSVKKMKSLIQGIGGIVKFFSTVAGFLISTGLNTLAAVFDPETYKKIFEFAKFMIGLAIFPIPLAISSIVKFWKSGKLQKSITQFMEGVGNLFKGLMAVLGGLGLGKFITGGGGGDPAKELEKPVEEEEETGTKTNATLEKGQVTGGNMTQEQAQAQIRYMELEEAMSDALENNDMKLYEQLEKEQSALPQFAKGGWIKGPMSGYPVSLDGGRSTSFIGHGTEYVAPKMAVGGGPLGQAFVIPYDTPATRQNPGLTNTRLLQAKSAGFNVAPMSAGGLLEAIGNTINAPNVPYKKIESKIGANKKMWDTFRNTIADIESSGKYRVFGGNNDMYDGRYQMGSLAKTDGARIMGMKDPGHDEDPKKFMRVMFRNNRALQERLFAGFTIANHNYLSSVKEYAEADLLRKMEILAYAHNQGWQGAKVYITQGKVGQDSFGTKGSEYSDRMKSAFQEANITPPVINNTSNVKNQIVNKVTQIKEAVKGFMSGDMINNNALDATESNETSMQVMAGDLNPIDLSAAPAEAPPVVSGGGTPYEIPANNYIKPRFGLLADLATQPVEIL